jgi:tetratricopeptide (TPR) repeat protein
MVIKTLLILILFPLTVLSMTPSQLKTKMGIYDHYYSQRDKLKNVEKAIKGHMQLLNMFPNNVELLWRLSMENYFLGHKTQKEAKKILYHQQGLRFGKKCIEASKGSRVECYFWKATNLALYLQAKGIFSIAFRIKDIIALYKKAEQLNVNYLGAGPLRMQSIFYYKAPSILGGDKLLAIKLIKKAIKIAPNEALNYHFFLQYLIDTNDTEQAKTVAQKAINSITPSKIPYYESRGAFQDIVEYLETGTFTP